MTEEWHSVPGYEGLYEMTMSGSVKRLKGPFCKEERLLKPRLSKNYIIYSLCKNGQAITQGVHRLLLLTFVGPPPTPLHEGNHIDGNKRNNAMNNLEWVSASENIRHMLRLGLRKERRGADNHAAKLTEDQALDIKRRYTSGEKANVLAAEYNIQAGHVKDIGRGYRWKHLPAMNCRERGRHMMKLTRSKVEELRALRQQGWTIRRLAERFGVSTTTIVHTVNGKYHAYTDL